MKYEFRLKNLPYKFQVVRFYSYEAISEIYQYDVYVISKEEMENILLEEAEFRLLFDKYEDKINGIVSEFEEIRKIRDFYYYKIKIVPKIYKLSLNKDSEVFLNKSIIEIFEELLKQHRLNSSDYEFKLINQYEKKEYVTQYLESDLDFIKRWCERLGIYFYFEQKDREKIVFIDSKLSQKNFPYNNEIYYSPVSGVEGENIYKSAQEIRIKRAEGIKNVKIKDYNPERPTYNLEVNVNLNENGRDVYIYEEYFQTKEEGEKLAKTIGESLDINREKIYIDSTVPNIYPGYNYLLKNFYKDEFNNKYYTVIEVKKEGSGDTFLSDSKNIFTAKILCIASDRQYRKEFLTKRPKISGVLLGKIDGETEETPFIDDQGRYKVIMPFVTESKPNGKASCWIRLLQPTGGGNKGFHFPLKKESEVAIAFVHGNPDRPVILGSLPNPQNPNVVSIKNSMQNIMRSQQNMKFIMDDEKKFIQLLSSDGNSYIKIR